jgi:hypothetical protein
MLYSGYVISDKGVTQPELVLLKQAIGSGKLKKSRNFNGKQYKLFGVGTIEWARHTAKSMQKASPGNKNDALKTTFYARAIQFGGSNYFGAVYDRTEYSKKR